MEGQTIHAADVLQLARDFRMRAAEAGDTLYRHLMLRTAVDLEDRAATLAKEASGTIRLSDRNDAAA